MKENKDVSIWKISWYDLTTFLDYPAEISKSIYSANLIEILNGKTRKYTKAKLSSQNDDVVKNRSFSPGGTAIHHSLVWLCKGIVPIQKRFQ